MLNDGSLVVLGEASLIAVPERALLLLSIFAVALAAALLAFRMENQ